MWFQKFWEESRAGSTGSRRVRIPVRQVHLTGRSDRAVEGCEQKVATTG
jgi:hypothetical protein